MVPKKTIVPRPEDDADFRALVSERQKLLEQREQSGRAWADLRAKIDFLGGEMSVRDIASEGWEAARAEQQKAYARISEIEAENAEAKRRLREIDNALPLTRQRAARKLAGAVSNEAGVAVRSYLVARVKAEAASLAAAAVLFPLADACSVRRVAMRPGVPNDLNHRKRELTELKDDVFSALKSGVLKKCALPAEVVEAWKLN